MTALANATIETINDLLTNGGTYDGDDFINSDGYPNNPCGEGSQLYPGWYIEDGRLIVWDFDPADQSDTISVTTAIDLGPTV